MKIPNKIRILIGRGWHKFFDKVFWDIYYKYGSLCPPKSYYYKEWLKDPESYEYDYLHYGEFYDPVCFPLPFKINCVGCSGCRNNSSPLLSPDKYKGPYKVAVTGMFCDQYEELFGKGALVELLYKLEKGNEEIDKKGNE